MQPQRMPYYEKKSLNYLYIPGAGVYYNGGNRLIVIK